MTPRPILKTLPGSESFPPLSRALPFTSSHGLIDSPHVHFPPTPILTSFQTTHSSKAYDRAPIVVSQNTCELPERGGRMYESEEEEDDEGGELDIDSPATPKGSYFHPRAFEACECEPLMASPPPSSALPDLSFSSSESDESDGIGSPQPSSPIPITAIASSLLFHHHTHHDVLYPPIPALTSNSTAPCSQEELDIALSFLPYPPSPVKDSSKSALKPVRRKRSCSERLQAARGDAPRRPKPSAFREPSLDDCLGGF